MRLLVLGGGWFLGRTVAQAAMDLDWSVTVFNRGRSSAAVPEGSRTVQGDRTVAADLKRLAGLGPWDAVVDTSASEMAPCDVLAGARALEPVCGRYVYVSTVNAYRGWPDEPLTEDSELLDGPADSGPDYGRGPGGWEDRDYYGRQKAGCERAAAAAFGEARTSILRPGVILGPGEYVGRLPWWLTRAARGGRMLAPGAPEKSIQPIDVRDVAEFALTQAGVARGGAYNCVAPQSRETMQGMLTACVRAVGQDTRLVWAPDKLLLDHDVQQWTELPLWRTHAGVWRIDSTRAQAAGLTCRPLAETVADTWAWLRDGGMPVEHPRWAEHGIAPEKEEAILAALGR